MDAPFKASFSDGLYAMTGHCLCAVELIKEGIWTIDDMEAWLKACQTNEAEYLREQVLQMKSRPTRSGQPSNRAI